MKAEITLRELQVEDGFKWEKLIIKGDFSCPACKSLMIVIATWSPYAFCPNCQKYWAREKTGEKE